MLGAPRSKQHDKLVNQSTQVSGGHPPHTCTAVKVSIGPGDHGYWLRETARELWCLLTFWIS